MDVQGNMVQDMVDAGKLPEVNDYCRCDEVAAYRLYLDRWGDWPNPWAAGE